MAKKIIPTVPTGLGAIKGGIFYGNLTPNGTFNNIPLTTAVDITNTPTARKLTLTLEQLKEELKVAANAENNTNQTDPLSEESINEFLVGYVQLLIDYQDLRNYVFFGPAYTELAYQINYASINFPFRSYFASDINLGPALLLTSLSGGYTKITFDLVDIIDKGNYTYDNSGATNWTLFDIIDENGTRFPIQSDGISPAFTLTVSTVEIIVKGTISTNNFIEYSPTVPELFKGLLVAPKLKVSTDFKLLTPKPILTLIDVNNPTPWPRLPITNNLEITGTNFDNWVENPNNSAPGIIEDDYGYVQVEEGLNLTGATTLDENVTNQLLRRSVPERIVNELNDTDDKFFTRFILIAGKFFDTIKVYIDFLKYTHTIEYSEFNQLSPQYYKLYAEHYGFDLFDDENIDIAKAIVRTEPGLRYDTGSNPIFDDLDTSKTLSELQAEKQKRLLINLFYLYKVKGTQKCIKFLTSLLGSPEGLVVLNEFAFNEETGDKITDNTKVHVPQIEYEIDPDYLIDKGNLNNPVNLPYVYRLKLSNENIHNLREISLGTDPQGAIATQIINFGKTLYPYGIFKPGSYANLQDENNSYRLLPLTLPDKYYGITTEYMIPKGGMFQGVGNNNDEVTIHLGSLFEVDDTSYGNKFNIASMSPSLSPILIILDPLPIIDLTQGEQITITGVVGNTAANGTWYVGNIINFQFNIFVDAALTTPVIGNGAFVYNPFGFQVVRANPVVVSSTQKYTYEVPATYLDLNNSLTQDRTYLNVTGASLVTGKPLIIAKLEGKDLVIRARLRDEITTSITERRVAIFKDVFEADGLNHQLRLIYRLESVEVYQDFIYLGLALWRDPSSVVGGPYDEIDIPKEKILISPFLSFSDATIAYPDNLNNDITKNWDLLVGLPINIEMYFLRVAVFEAQSIDQSDTLDFGIDTSGRENEKFSFSWNDQSLEEDTLSIYFNQKLKYNFKIKGQFRASNPQVPGSNMSIEDYFSLLTIDNILPELILHSKHQLGGEVEYREDVQHFYKLPNGELLTVENLFKYNAWSPTIHKDYAYESFYNEAYRNYELFSAQVLTYLALLPFMELIESKFQSLVKQFIPIVINLSEFGRIIRNNPFDQIKVHYTQIHDLCDATVIANNARGSFIVEFGTYNSGINTIEVLIDGNQYSLLDWSGSNILTASALAANITLNGGPNITASNNGNQVIIYIDADWYYTTFLLDVNDAVLSINVTGDVVYDNVVQFTGGERAQTGEDCFILQRDSIIVPSNRNNEFIYYDSENAAPKFIYKDVEGIPPFYI